MTPRNPAKTTPRVLTLLAIVVIVASLYFAQEVLVPIALAMLLSFLLAPLVRRLERLAGRITAVMTVAVLAFSLIGLLGFVLTGQVMDFAAKLPDFKENIVQKIKTIRAPASHGPFKSAQDTIKKIGEEIAKEPVDEIVGPPAPETSSSSATTVAKESPKKPPGKQDPSGDEASKKAAPNDQPSASSPFDFLLMAATPLLKPLGTAGIVIILVIFILLQREQLRDRFIRLIGSRLSTTTKALDDAGRRVSRYLLMQLIVNVSFGIPVAIGLYFIGVPNYILWGLLAAALRYIPYVGAWIAAAIPIALAMAVFPGWSRPLLVAGLFLGLELISNNVMEPWLYASTTGVSTLALLVAAILWTWLWGPIGLVLSTPLTVCLVVLGRHVPHLEFLNILFGDEEVLSPEMRFYQRLLALDQEEASDLLEEQKKDKTLVELYDQLVLPALILEEEDRHAGHLDEKSHRFVIDGTREIIEELGERADKAAAESEDEKPAWRGPVAPLVLCVPARDEADELAAMMLAQLLEAKGMQARVESRLSVEGAVDRIARGQADLLCISSVPPGSVLPARHACKRLLPRMSNKKILVCLWKHKDVPEARKRLGSLCDDRVVTTLAQAVELAEAAVSRVAAPAQPPPIPADEESRLLELQRIQNGNGVTRDAFIELPARLGEVFAAPMALVSFIDRNTQVFASHHGLPESLTVNGNAPREAALCSYVVGHNQSIVVEDLQRDDRFAGNQAVRDLGLRFYAGVPLRSKNGQPVGSLCIMDIKPRRMSERERRLLEMLSESVMARIEGIPESSEPDSAPAAAGDGAQEKPPAA